MQDRAVTGKGGGRGWGGARLKVPGVRVSAGVEVRARAKGVVRGKRKVGEKRGGLATAYAGWLEED